MLGALLHVNYLRWRLFFLQCLNNSLSTTRFELCSFLRRLNDNKRFDLFVHLKFKFNIIYLKLFIVARLAADENIDLVTVVKNKDVIARNVATFGRNLGRNETTIFFLAMQQTRFVLFRNDSTETSISSAFQNATNKNPVSSRFCADQVQENMIFYERHGTEVGFEEFAFVALNFAMLDGTVVEEGVQLYCLVRSSSILVLHEENKVEIHFTVLCQGKNTGMHHDQVLKRSSHL